MQTLPVRLAVDYRLLRIRTEEKDRKRQGLYFGELMDLFLG